MNFSTIQSEYVRSDITTRFLHESELPVRTKHEKGPLVFEARSSRDVHFLKTFLASHSANIRQALDDYGAIILRGFSIEKNDDFENLISSIQGLRAMNDYFMAECGRSKLNDTGKVFHTNKYFKTGGGFYLGGIHSENFYTTDVPEFVSFWCTKQPWMGGETALIHMANAYDELDEELKQLLEGESAFACSYPLKDIAARYEVSEARLQETFPAVGLPISNDERRRIDIYKPIVFKHPRTHRKALLANLSIELKGLDQFLSKLFLPSYASPVWAIHRMGWKSSAIYSIIALLEMLPQFIAHPSIFLEIVQLLRKSNQDNRNPHKLINRLNPKHIEALALAVWRHCYAFAWKQGDVLIFDNLQMLHTGMPGWGSRELRVMLCNPVALPYSVGPGVVEVPPSGTHQSVDERLRLATTGEN